VIRVCWFLDNLRAGGAERLPLLLAPRLRDARIEVVPIKDQVEHEIPPGLTVSPLVPGTARLSRVLPAVLAGAARAARGADVVVGGMEWMPTFVATAAACWSRRPAVAVVHTDLAHFHDRDRLPPAAWWLLRRALASCRAVVAVSPDVRGAVEALGVPPGRIHVIPNPVPRGGVTRSPAGPVPRLLSVGRLHWAKGHDLALDAAALLGGDPFTWDIVGEGPEGDALRQRAAGPGLAGRVRFPGFQPDPRPWLGAADLFVLSSRVEGLPLALLEAMAAGLPIVATRCGRGVEEALSDGAAGVLVPPGDPGALAAAIRALLSDPGRRRDLGDAALRRSLDYDPEPIAARYERVFQAVMG
jgi:glycosyltransferase involved in cell wall biosynthesis